MNSIVCTLFEGQYHHGAAALFNSLYSHGFRGTVYAGYRGDLPSWANPIEESAMGFDYHAAEGLTVRFKPLQTALHLTNYKPTFMIDLLEHESPQATSMFYFDPDIVVTCRWPFFEEWAREGVAVCQDVNGIMPNSHPLRHAWRRILSKQGFSFANQHELYFNGGFVGVVRENCEFVLLWKQIIDAIAEAGVSLDEIGVGDRSQAFTCKDQDALNIALMSTSCPISAVGQDGMDFQPGGGGWIMSHAVGSTKPWNHCFTLRALRGHRISRATRHFLRAVQGPIQPYTSNQYFVKQLDKYLAIVAGRVFS